MTVDTSDMLKSIFDTFSGLDYIRPEDIPNIDLYMDQVTTFMEEHLKKTRRYPEDKILTKTMINNYAKNNLLPSPEKKRYSKDHLLMLIFIYYFKNILSITDIQKLLQMSHKKAKKIYEMVSEMENQELGEFRAHDNKVALKKVLRCLKIDYNFLVRQCQLEEQKKEPSASLAATESSR